MAPSTTNRKRNERIELRATREQKELFERAAAQSDTTITAFMLDSGTEVAHRVLADRSRFVLDDEQLAAWEALNDRPAVDLPGLRRLMQRPSPFVDE